MDKSNEQIRQEMAEVQQELQSALQELLTEVGKKLKPKEREEIELEFRQIDELLERLKTGLVWIALFGKTSVGKSAIANALLEDDIAEVGIQHDLTTSPAPYKKEPWMIVDVPGIMGEKVNEKIAIEEAKKAHGHIFVVNEEPFGYELELFDLVHAKVPLTPKIVFVNKWDEMAHRPKKDRDIVKARIEQKMGKFVKNPDEIIYGCAEIFDPQRDKMVRQKLPQLLDKMYNDAGTLGAVMNVLDPANRANDFAGAMRTKILDVRMNLGRKIISWFGAASAVGTFIPYSTLVVTPGLLASMVYTLFRIMGNKEMTKSQARKIAIDLLKECGKNLAAEFGAVVVAEMIVGSMYILGPIGALVGLAADLAGLTYFRYRRTVILGEVTLEYIRHDCSWGGENPHDVILRCKERALRHYMRLAKRDEN